MWTAHSLVFCSDITVVVDDDADADDLIAPAGLSC